MWTVFFFCVFFLDAGRRERFQLLPNLTSQFTAGLSGWAKNPTYRLPWNIVGRFSTSKNYTGKGHILLKARFKVPLEVFTVTTLTMLSGPGWTSVILPIGH